jgi:hypothetical protein
MKRSLSVFGALIAVLAVAAPALGKIAVGKGIDGVRLGDSLAAVKHKLGRPEHTARNATGTSFRLDYTKRKLVISVNKKRGVIELNTFNKHERTSKGVGPGSTFAAVKKAYPGACGDLKYVPVCAVNDGKTLTQFSAAALHAKRIDGVKVQALRY